jgi:hypothetical protein
MAIPAICQGEKLEGCGVVHETHEKHGKNKKICENLRNLWTPFFPEALVLNFVF